VLTNKLRVGRNENTTSAVLANMVKLCNAKGWHHYPVPIQNIVFRPVNIAFSSRLFHVDAVSWDHGEMHRYLLSEAFSECVLLSLMVKQPCEVVWRRRLVSAAPVLPWVG
jgi:hypothetical protein